MVDVNHIPYCGNVAMCGTWVEFFTTRNPDNCPYCVLAAEVQGGSNQIAIYAQDLRQRNEIVFKYGDRLPDCYLVMCVYIGMWPAQVAFKAFYGMLPTLLTSETQEELVGHLEALEAIRELSL